MLFLSSQESAEWSGHAEEVLRSGTAPGTYDGDIRPNLLSAFDYYIGTVLAARGRAAEGIEWLSAAALGEESEDSCRNLLPAQDGRPLRQACHWSPNYR